MLQADAHLVWIRATSYLPFRCHPDVEYKATIKMQRSDGELNSSGNFLYEPSVKYLLQQN